MQGNNNIIITETPKEFIPTTKPFVPFAPDSQFNRDDFDAQVQQKGYDVILEKGIRCPCAEEQNGSHSSQCVNCGGYGFVFVNPISTKMVIQTMAYQKEFLNWTELNKGTASVTTLSKDKIAYSDRITHTEAQTIYEELVYPKKVENLFESFLIYPIESLDIAYSFQGFRNPLKLISKEQIIFEKGKNKVYFDFGINEIYPTITIRYFHKPSYMVIDIMRDIMRLDARKQDLTIDNIEFPKHCIAKRLHLTLGSQNSRNTSIEDGFI